MIDALSITNFGRGETVARHDDDVLSRVDHLDRLQLNMNIDLRNITHVLHIDQSGSSNFFGLQLLAVANHCNR